VREVVEAAIRSVLPRSRSQRPFTESTNLQRDLGLDSLSKVSVAVLLEKELGVSLDSLAEQLPDMQTVGDVLRAIDALLASSQASVR
jgi:acyl carrier protein